MPALDLTDLSFGGLWPGPRHEIAVSRHLQWLAYCEARLRGGGLADIAGTSIIVRKLPWNRNMTKPGIFVTLAGHQESETQLGGILGTNMHVVESFGAQLTLIRASNQDLELDDSWLIWRERVNGLFTPTSDNPVVYGLPWVENIVREPGPTIDSGGFERGFDVQALIVRAVGRRLRGSV